MINTGRIDMKLKKIININENCWDGYEMVGMKMKDGKEVPNCVPKNEVKESVSIKKDRRGNDTDNLIVKLDGKEYEVAFSGDGWKDAYGISFPKEDTYRMLNKDKKAKEMWNKLKPMIDKYLKTKNENTEFSSYINKMGADMKFIREVKDVKASVIKVGDKISISDKYSPNMVHNVFTVKTKEEKDGYITFKGSGGRDILKVKTTSPVALYESTKSAPGEWVVFLSTNKGKKLLKTFKSATPAKSWMKKNADKFLEKDVSIGAMTKQQWDEREAKWAIESVNEGKWSDIMKGVRGGEQRGPWTIVVADRHKVVDQQIVDVRDAIPAHYEHMKRKHPNHRITIEDNSGMVVFRESVSIKPIIKENIQLVPYKGYSINGKEYTYHGMNAHGSHIFRKGATSWVIDDDKLKSQTIKSLKETRCGCGGVKTSNPYSLKEFVINESKYNFGKVEYTAKNMGPVEIQDLAFAYHHAPLNKLVSKNQDTKIRVARDLGRLVGKNPMNPTEKGKESAWLLYPYKGKLINTDDYKEIYTDLMNKLKKVSSLAKKVGGAGSSSAAKAAAKADMKEGILNEKLDTSSTVTLIKSAASNNVKSVDITLKSPKSMGEWDELQKKFNLSLWPDKLLHSIKKDMDTEKKLSFDIVKDATEIIDLIKNDSNRIKNINWK
jgi:hypothetical protein